MYTGKLLRCLLVFVFYKSFSGTETHHKHVWHYTFSTLTVPFHHWLFPLVWSERKGVCVCRCGHIIVLAHTLNIVFSQSHSYMNAIANITRQSDNTVFQGHLVKVNLWSHNDHITIYNILLICVIVLHQVIQLNAGSQPDGTILYHRYTMGGREGLILQRIEE